MKGLKIDIRIGADHDWQLGLALANTSAGANQI
jgi:hypothetical protein